MNKIILVTGDPGTGKTTISQKIADRFNLQRISVDEIQETIFDSMDLEEDDHDVRDMQLDGIGKTAFELIYYYLTGALARGNGLIVDAHFKAEWHNERMQDLEKKYDRKIIQINLQSEPEILKKRVIKRDQTDERHKLHLERMSKKQKVFLAKFGTVNRLLELEKTLIMNTNDLAKVDLQEIYQFIEK